MRLALPSKGRLSARTLDLLQRAGFKVHMSHERQLYAQAGELTLYFARADDIPSYVQDGVADLGVTGHDILMEQQADVLELLDLGYGACRLVVAAPEESHIESMDDVPDGARIASSFPHLTRQFFAGKNVKVVKVSGSTELTPHIGVADLITDLTSSGSTMAMNGLVEIGEILHSTARIVANPDLRDDPPRYEAALRFVGQIKSVLAAEGRRYVMANVPSAAIDKVRQVMPGLRGPTVLEVAQNGFVAAHAVVAEPALNQTIEALKELGAEGILVLPIERLIP